jgi:hypothetical protein
MPVIAAVDPQAIRPGELRPLHRPPDAVGFLFGGIGHLAAGAAGAWDTIQRDHRRGPSRLAAGLVAVGHGLEAEPRLLDRATSPLVS